MIGDSMHRFLDEMLELVERSGELKVHFATAREAFNMAMAAVDAQPGEPGSYRDYKLRQIMDEKRASSEQKLQTRSRQGNLYLAEPVV